MTDYKSFVAMLMGAHVEYQIYKNSLTVSATFPIHGGIAGSTETVGEAFFNVDTEKFLDIHHCD